MDVHRRGFRGRLRGRPGRGEQRGDHCAECKSGDGFHDGRIIQARLRERMGFRYDEGSPASVPQ